MARDIVQPIIAITIAIIVASMILIPMVGTATDMTYNGEAHTENNSVQLDPQFYGPYTGDAQTITITVTSESVTGTDLTTIVTNNQYITVDTVGKTVNVWSNAGLTTYSSDGITGTVSISTANIVLVNYANATGATYSLWNGTTITGLSVEKVAPLYVYDGTVGSERYVTESVLGTAIPIASEAVDGQKDIYAITGLSNADSGVIAPLTYTYYDQIPAVDENIQAILDVVPLLVIIAVLMAAIYLFIGGRR